MRRAQYRAPRAVEFLGRQQLELDESRESVVDVRRLLAHDLELVRGPVQRERVAVAIVDQAARRRDRVDADAVALREVAEVVVPHDLQVDEAGAERTEQHHDPQRGREHAPAEQALLGVVVLESYAAGHAALVRAAGQAERRVSESPTATINGQSSAPGDHRQPAHPRGVAVSRQPVDPEDDEVIQREQHHDRRGLVHDREHAHAQLQAVGQEPDHEEPERVLAEHHAAQHVEEEARQPRVAESRDARAGQDEIDHREQREIGAHGVEPGRQRHDREHEPGGHAEPVEQSSREQARLPHSPAPVAGAGARAVSVAPLPAAPVAPAAAGRVVPVARGGAGAGAAAGGCDFAAPAFAGAAAGTRSAGVTSGVNHASSTSRVAIELRRRARFDHRERRAGTLRPW